MDGDAFSLSESGPALTDAGEEAGEAGAEQTVGRASRGKPFIMMGERGWEAGEGCRKGGTCKW